MDTKECSETIYATSVQSNIDKRIAKAQAAKEAKSSTVSEGARRSRVIPYKRTFGDYEDHLWWPETEIQAQRFHDIAGSDVSEICEALVYENGEPEKLWSAIDRLKP